MEGRACAKGLLDAILAPIPKKDNLFVVIIVEELLCLMLLENWLQELCKLLTAACGERVTGGFRKGHGCTDMNVMVWQLTEKATEHNTNQIFVFVDIRKAYDSVPCAALWIALWKLGVPEDMIKLVK